MRDFRLRGLNNEGCICETYAWSQFTPAQRNGHHPACPHVNRRCDYCHELVAKNNCSTMYCGTRRESLLRDRR